MLEIFIDVHLILYAPAKAEVQNEVHNQVPLCLKSSHDLCLCYFFKEQIQVPLVFSGLLALHFCYRFVICTLYPESSNAKFVMKENPAYTIFQNVI